MKKTNQTTMHLLILLTALLFTACNFTIIGENDDEVVLEKLDLKMIERNVTLEELSGTWVIDEASIERNLKFNNKLGESRRKELKEVYINIDKNGTVEFLNSYYKHKVYKGRVNLGYIPKQWMPPITKNDYYIRISSLEGEHWKSKNLFFIELNNKFYLGEKYYGGDIDAGNERTYYLLYKKVETKERTHGKN